jgi:SsrA-binding protein
MSDRSPGVKLIAQNKKARHLYELLDFFEAGLALTGSEVKSLRAGKVSFKDGYVVIRDHEAWLLGLHISPYENAGYAQHDPERERKLLLHASEIKQLRIKIEQKGLTVVPVKMYFKNSKAKVEIALARGKNVHDRRADIKDRDIKRDTAQELAKYK